MISKCVINTTLVYLYSEKEKENVVIAIDHESLGLDLKNKIYLDLQIK